MSAAGAPEAPFNARYNLADVLSYIQGWQGKREVQFFDLFSGVGEATKLFRANGYVTKNYDINMGDDITKRAGFFKALDIVMAMAIGALILMGPPCSLWVFMSSAYHRRSKCNPDGDTSKEAVRNANVLVRNLCFLMAVAHFRQVFLILEQPSSSQMCNYSWLAQICQSLDLKRIVTWMKEYGHAIAKPTYLLSNMVTANLLRRIWSRKRELRRKAQQGDKSLCGWLGVEAV